MFLPKAQTSDLLLNLLYRRTSGGDHRTGNFDPMELVYSSSRTYLQQITGSGCLSCISPFIPPFLHATNQAQKKSTALRVTRGCTPHGLQQAEMSLCKQAYVSQDWERDMVTQKHSQFGQMWRESCSQETRGGGKKEQREGGKGTGEIRKGWWKVERQKVKSDI